jgi:uncharacterized coiled-coil DUF342 family protein
MAQVPDAYSELLDATRAEADQLHADASRLRMEASKLMQRAEQISAVALAAEQRAQELDEVLGRAPQLRLERSILRVR